MVTPSRSRSSGRGEEDNFEWRQTIEKMQLASERQLKALLQETERLREENVVLRIQASTSGPPRRAILGACNVRPHEPHTPMPRAPRPQEPGRPRPPVATTWAPRPDPMVTPMVQNVHPHRDPMVTPVMRNVHSHPAGSVRSFRRTIPVLRSTQQNISTLQNIKMQDSESLREFVKRFGQVVLQVKACSMDVVLQIFKRSICPSTPFFESLAKKPPTTMDDLFRRANKYSMLENDVRAATQQVLVAGRPLEVKRKEMLNLRTGQGRLTEDRKGLSDFRWPRPQGTDPSTRDHSKSCVFHKEHGHTTETCRSLQYLVEKLIKAGHLKQYLRSDTEGKVTSQHHNPGAPGPQPPPGPILTEIHLTRNETIIFPPVDPTRILQPHCDALILSLEIGDFDVRRILVDPGSSVDLVQASVVATWDTVSRALKILDESYPGSTDRRPHPWRHHTAVQAGPVTLNVQFSVVQELSPFNIILGRTWLHYMKAIPLHIIKWLNVFSTAKPVRQKIMRFHPDRQKVIRNEIDKLLEAGFIKEVAYPDWLANVVVILMAPADEEKTAFITPYDLYYYKVMPFRLKNAGTTYQRLMTKIFKPLIGHTVEKYDMKLNPSKCAFGVSAGKFLGFMVSQKGIEVSPDQVKAIMETPPPRSKKELQRLTGKLVALGRFIARFTDELRHFFLAIRKAGANGWTDSYQNAFEKIKHCLTQPPILSSPVPKEKLYIYLAVSEWAINAVLFAAPHPRSRNHLLRQVRSRLLLQFPTGEHLEQAIRLGFPASNNEVEYEVILSGLDLALALSISKLRVYSDSQLVVRHIQEEYEAKDARMAQYLTKVNDTLQQFTEWTVEKIRRTENRRADTLAGMAASLPIKEVILLPIHVQTDPSIVGISTCNTIEANQTNTKSGRTILQNISGQALYPEILKQTHKIRVQAARFTLIGGHLYKRSFTGPYLRCLGHSEAQYVLAELHGGVCVNHSGGRSLAHRAHSQGYYCPTMKKDAAAYVKKYVTKFVWKNIVCYFGIPQTIIADNGPQFDSIAFKKFCSELNIRNSYSTPRYPQSNGQAEATNKL
ncbi:Retrovirus-related Pol polyprotein from transposon 17.6 [Vitis vinifera]|uniref:Retrovirus-related Pol polyprotein from transposon 17.6 n=1 Tax=Vitis vinifera TaxID=29760 RepID=A0A438G3F4_VITVI|nr:Retrovirus-related Pol polyprotein from transposon 17.6 [Vitis vinifera]